MPGGGTGTQREDTGDQEVALGCREVALGRRGWPRALTSLGSGLPVLPAQLPALRRQLLQLAWGQGHAEGWQRWRPRPTPSEGTPGREETGDKGQDGGDPDHTMQPPGDKAAGELRGRG